MWSDGRWNSVEIDTLNGVVGLAPLVDSDSELALEMSGQEMCGFMWFRFTPIVAIFGWWRKLREWERLPLAAVGAMVAFPPLADLQLEVLESLLEVPPPAVSSDSLTACSGLRCHSHCHLFALCFQLFLCGAAADDCFWRWWPPNGVACRSTSLAVRCCKARCLPATKRGEAGGGCAAAKVTLGGTDPHRVDEAKLDLAACCCCCCSLLTGSSALLSSAEERSLLLGRLRRTGLTGLPSLPLGGSRCRGWSSDDERWWPIRLHPGGRSSGGASSAPATPAVAVAVTTAAVATGQSMRAISLTHSALLTHSLSYARTRGRIWP